MAEDAGCGYCTTALEAFCVVFRMQGPLGREDAFCDLRTRYYTEGLKPDYVFGRLAEIATPDQSAAVQDWIEDRRASGLGPISASEEFRPGGTPPRP